jgi:ribonuclease HI
LVLYTDGSVELDKQSGAPATLYCQNWFVQKQTTRCGSYTRSSRAEFFAIELGLTTLLEYTRYQRITRTTAATATDSYSLFATTMAGPITVQEGTLRRMWAFILQPTKRRVRLSFQFVFGHRAFPRNKAVDKLAKSAMSNAVISRAWITDLITTVRRHRNLFRNIMGSPHTS